jgi:hypothetical protein
MPIDEKALTYAYATEKFGCALEALASAPGRPQDGLHDAWMCFNPVRPDDLPAGELRSLFMGIRGDLTCEEPVGNEGTLAATLRKMSDAKCISSLSGSWSSTASYAALSCLGGCSSIRCR